MKSEQELRKDICEVGRRLYAKNLTVATDGNISIKLGSNRYLCTPSGVSKGFMKPSDLIISDAKGERISGRGKVTSEIMTHMAAYEERPDVNAVVHAHPPKATGFTLAGVSLAQCVLPELLYSIGGIPTSRYATPATPEGGQVVRELVGKCDALMLERHGALTLGVDVFDALFKMEKIEHAADCLLTANLLGHVSTLSEEQVEKLNKVRESYGCSGHAFACSIDCACSKSTPAEDTAHPDLDHIVQETLKALGHGQ